MSVRIVSRSKVQIIGRSGGGRVNPVAQQLVEAFHADQLAVGGDGAFFTDSEMMSLLGVREAKDLKPGNVSQSFKKVTGQNIGYKQAIDAEGQHGFYYVLK